MRLSAFCVVFSIFWFRGLAEPSLAAAPAFARNGLRRGSLHSLRERRLVARQDSNLQPDRYERGTLAEMRTKSAFPDQDHSRLCMFVQGVSAG
jgi:hypothetical protein